MLEQSEITPLFHLTFHGNGISIDGMRPMSQVPGLQTVIGEGQMIYPPKKQPLTVPMSSRKFGTAAIDVWEDPTSPYFCRGEDVKFQL